MLIEELLSNLSERYEKIIVVYFSDQQERIDKAQLSLFNKVSERLFDEGGEVDGEEAVYLLSVPHDGLMNSVDIRGLNVSSRSDAYVLFNGSPAQMAGGIITALISNGSFLRKAYSFRSLGQSHCLEFSRCSDEDLGSMPFSNDMIDIKERKIGELSRKNEALVNEIEVLERNNQTLKSLWGGAKQEIDYYKSNNRAIKSSFSYRFGNLFAEAVKSPRKLIALPLSLFDFLASGAWKKVVFHYKNSRIANGAGKKKYNKNEGFQDVKDGALRALINKVGDGDVNKLASYLTNFEPTGDWVALVGESEASPPKALQLSGDMQQVHPNTWFSLFKKLPPGRVVIDHEAVSLGGKWASCIEGGAYGYPYHLVEMLSYCSSHSIEIVLWKRSEGQSDLVSDFSSLISKIYVSEE